MFALCQCYEFLLTRTVCTDFFPGSEGCTLCYSAAWLVSLVGEWVSPSCRTWLGWVVSFTSRPLYAEKEPVYPLNRRLSGLESRSGRFRRTENVIIMCLMFRAFIRFYKIFKKTNKCAWIMNVFLLCSNHRHVSATLVTVFRAVSTRIQL
jgi:hypothetical protein